jgi:hypothetical protein
MGIGGDLKAKAEAEKVATEVTDEVTFNPIGVPKDEIIVTESKSAEFDVKKAVNVIDVAEGKEPKYKIGDPSEEAFKGVVKTLRDIDTGAAAQELSDGSTANYYVLPEGATELYHLIIAKDMNAQMGEIGRAWYRYGQVAHSPKKRDIKKIIAYAQQELERLEKYGDS